MGSSCCPYENAKDDSIRMRWENYRDEYSAKWNSYFGAKWSNKTKFQRNPNGTIRLDPRGVPIPKWDCHGNEAHGYVSDPFNSEFFQLGAFGRLHGIGESRPGRLPNGERGSTTFGSLELHMIARNDFVDNFKSELAALKADLDARHAAGESIGFRDSQFKACFDMKADIGGGWRTENGKTIEVPGTSLVEFIIAYDPEDQTFYEITGYPKIA